eukprot:CAMPEP_0184967166 /NCGR_PEP_ID=MMETSP1098-20130426/637_1 /TAXON_ID=89044 /ORGANISM="Spumella elongata, Strain CCAP 955/1" /LENGTH=590 /DNA_ID=CAMNT_0027488579 /DNA_START=62 /DNA_END=1834 /DNA_ORIENTATION=+
MMATHDHNHTGTLPSMLCCVCGIVIQQNPSNMCVSCVRNTVDITTEISKKVTIHSCRSCGRFLAPPWQSMALESKELMTVCLRKVTGLSKVKLIDAVWIWTEPHSLRLKIKLTVQKEVINGAVLQQASVVEFVIRNQQCKACEASFAQGNWHAIVQVRQRVPHKRTFFFLEQLILKHESHMECIKIETYRDGMDFYFQSKNQALRFIEFLNGNVPTKMKYSRKLVSADKSDNTANFKHNFLVDIVPICKDDMLILPKELARNLSNISRLVLAKRIGSGIHIVDPLTGEHSEISTDKYWRHSFKAVMTSRSLIRYVVLNVEPILTSARPSAKIGKIRGSKAGSVSRGRGASMDSVSIMGSMLGSVITDRKLRLAEVTLARESDLGVNDTQFVCVSHLGNILREGDIALGYDFTTTNWNIEEEEDQVLNKQQFPDLILVRKLKETKQDRKWTLRKLDASEAANAQLSSAEQAAHEADYEAFMQELESDRDMRSKLNLYKITDTRATKKPSAAEGGMEVEGTEETPRDRRTLDEDEVRLDELLDDLALEEAAPEADVEEEGSAIAAAIVNGAAASAGGEQSVFAFDPAGMKFV